MEPVTVERQGAVAWVWLNRPERLNALNQASIERLYAVFEGLGGDETVRAIVLAGRGRAFCAGFDIEWMAGRTPAMVREDRVYLRRFFDVIEGCPQPVISAVQGDAMGGGLILTMVSDMVVASEAARFGVPEIKIGIFPSLRLIPRLERLVGMRAAKMMALTGDPVDAATALNMGLVTQVTTGERLYETAAALAAQVAESPMGTARAIKAAFVAHPQGDYADWETEAAVTCWAQPEREMLMQRFLAKRKRRE